jgi:hypothetical protein
MITRKNVWDGSSKVAVAVNQVEGASVMLFDPEYEQVITIKIPEGTEIEAANQLGIWKINAIWKLGKQKGIGGKLLSDSITKYFRFPVSAWADEGALGLASDSMFDLYKGILGIYSSNLTLGDKVSMAWFSFHVANAKRVEVDLVKSGFLVADELSDGEEGYVLAPTLPKRVLSLFADDDIAKGENIVAIKDATGQSTTASDVGNVVEVLGAKVALVDKTDKKEIDCLVRGTNELLKARIANLFTCDIDTTESSFSTEVILGTEFAKRF